MRSYNFLDRARKITETKYFQRTYKLILKLLAPLTPDEIFKKQNKPKKNQKPMIWEENH